MKSLEDRIRQLVQLRYVAVQAKTKASLQAYNKALDDFIDFVYANNLGIEATELVKLFNWKRKADDKIKDYVYNVLGIRI